MQDVPPWPQLPEEIERDILQTAVDAGHAMPWKLAHVNKYLRKTVFCTASLWPGERVRAFVNARCLKGHALSNVPPPEQLAGYLRAIVIAGLGTRPHLDDLRGAAQLLYEIEANVGEQAAARGCGEAGVAFYAIPYSPLAQANWVSFALVHRALGDPEFTATAPRLEAHQFLAVGSVLDECLRMLHRTDAPYDALTMQVVRFWWRRRSTCAMSFLWVHAFDIAPSAEAIVPSDLLDALGRCTGRHIHQGCLNELMQMTAEYVVRVAETPVLVDITRQLLRVHLMAHLRAIARGDNGTGRSELIDMDVLRNLLGIVRVLLYALGTADWIGLLCRNLFRVMDDPRRIGRHWNRKVHSAVRRMCCAALLTAYHNQIHNRAVDDEDVAAQRADGNIFAQYVLGLVRTLPCSTAGSIFHVGWAWNYEAALALAIAACLAPTVICEHVQAELEAVWRHAEEEMAGGPGDQATEEFCSSNMGYMTPGWRWDYARNTLFNRRRWKYYYEVSWPYPANMWSAASEPWKTMQSRAVERCTDGISRREFLLAHIAAARVRTSTPAASCFFETCEPSELAHGWACCTKPYESGMI